MGRNPGRKFLTQAVGERLARDHFDPSRIAASRRPRAIEPRAVVQALDDPRQWEPLFTTAVTSIAQLVTLYANDDFRFQGFLNNVTERWATLASEVKSIAYEGGLVRRTGERDAIARAPIVTRVCNDAIDRAYQCLGVLRLGFSLNGVHNDDVGRARAAMTDVVRSAAAGRLVSLHAGFGRVAAHDTIKLTAFTADAGRYSGTWAAPTCSNRPGTPVWGLMWSVDGEDGRRSTHVEILKVGLRPPSRGEAEMTVGAAK